VDDRELVAQFEACTLAPAHFTHRNHVRVAWLYLSEAPLPEARSRFVDALTRYAASLGASAKYNERITFHYMAAIHDRMQRGRWGSFESFAEAHPELFARSYETFR
jgi:hypothetical protein